MAGLRDHASRNTGIERICGLDLGTKTIGIALSDVMWRIASPAFTLKRSKLAKDMAEILAFANEQRVAAFILGLPISMDGTSGPRVQATKAFMRSLGQQTQIPIILWDERLSTMAVEKAMIAADLSRSKRAAKIDASAAAYILQGALDHFNARLAS